MITLFQVNGVMIYVDPYGKQTGYEDVFTKIDMCRKHYAERARRGFRGPVHAVSFLWLFSLSPMLETVPAAG